MPAGHQAIWTLSLYRGEEAGVRKGAPRKSCRHCRALVQSAFGEIFRHQTATRMGFERQQPGSRPVPPISGFGVRVPDGALYSQVRDTLVIMEAKIIPI